MSGTHHSKDDLSPAPLAYDELATRRPYRLSIEHYALLGLEVMSFVCKITSDEGRQFRNLMKLLREGHFAPG